MVIKIRKKIKGDQRLIYKSSKIILTPLDIKKADKLDSELHKTIKKLEKLMMY